jgi:hypothetical protein
VRAQTQALAPQTPQFDVFVHDPSRCKYISKNLIETVSSAGSSVLAPIA